MSVEDSSMGIGLRDINGRRTLIILLLYGLLPHVLLGGILVTTMDHVSAQEEGEVTAGLGIERRILRGFWCSPTGTHFAARPSTDHLHGQVFQTLL